MTDQRYTNAKHETNNRSYAVEVLCRSCFQVKQNDFFLKFLFTNFLERYYQAKFPLFGKRGPD